MAFKVWRYPLAMLWLALVLAAGFQEEPLSDHSNLDLEDLVMASSAGRYTGQAFGVVSGHPDVKGGWGDAPEETKRASEYSDIGSPKSPLLKEGLDAEESMELCDKTWCRPKHTLEALFTQDNKKFHQIGELAVPSLNFEIKFAIQARNDAHIALCNQKGFPTNKKGECYEVVIGGWANSKSTIRPAIGGRNYNIYGGRLLDKAAFTIFYIRKVGNHLEVGKSGTKEPFMRHTFYGDEIVNNVRHIGVMTESGSTGVWKKFQVKATEFRPRSIDIYGTGKADDKKGESRKSTPQLTIVQVSGRMDSDSIVKACNAQSLRPVCDHAKYFDGQCEVIGGYKHMSRRTEGADGVYFYAGAGRGKKALQQLPRQSHRWSDKHDQNGITLCATPKTSVKDCSFKYRGYELERVAVKGYMTSKNIYKACQDKMMKPVCDRAEYQDGKCISAGGRWSFSHPTENKKHGIDTSKVEYAFFYCGKAKHTTSRLNEGKGHGHKWTRENHEKDGDTFCGKRDLEFLKKYESFEHSGYTLKRVAVKGTINSQSIYDACQKKNLRPVCDHAAYFDGRCEVVAGHKHLSRDDKSTGVTNTFLYCGRANKALQHLSGSHRWTTGHDADGDTLCTMRKAAATLSFKFRGWEMKRVAVQGTMTSANIRKACKAKSMKPVCDKASYQDGYCKAMGNWHFSDPHHERQHGIDVKKVQYAFFYCGKANHQRSLLNTGKNHKWTHNNDRDGDTYCVKRDSDFMKKHGKFKHNNYELNRVPVSGLITSDSIYAACRAKGMNPVCDHAAYFDGRCEPVGGHKHMSRQDKIKGTWAAYFYCGFEKGNKASQHQHGNNRRWSNSNDKDGQTICTKRRELSEFTFQFKHYNLHRVTVDGLMTSANILQACKQAKMKPVCDRGGGDYQDGKCKAFGTWHFSSPHHNKQNGIDVKKVQWAFFYSGQANGTKSRINTGTSHKWTQNNRERDGDTFCSIRDASFLEKHGTFGYNGYTLKRVAVPGKINTDAIFDACQAKGLRPVCDHGAYFDGRCIVAGGNKHMSRQANITGVTNAYFYCGSANGNMALQHQHRRHRWSTNHDTDGETLCTTPKTDVKFNFRGYNMHRVPVKGYMTSDNIFKTCEAEGMKPVCDHPKYMDGKCKVVGGAWHFSHPPHNRQVNLERVKWAFFYSGEAKGKTSRINMGNSNKWTHNNRERDGDTFCVKRDEDWLKKFGTFKLKDYTLIRHGVKGLMDSKNIIKACSAKGMKPVCDHAAYFDGECEVVMGHEHLSQQGAITGVNGAFFYCGHANHTRARQHLEGNKHRWSNNNDRDGETLCTKRKKPLQFKYKHYIMYRTPVPGYMNSPTIYKACEAKGMKPLCDHRNYQDGKCKAVGGSWHFSDPHHDRRYGIDINKVQYAFFYCGGAKQRDPNPSNRSRLNTGISHKWTHDNRERDGDTFCVKRDPAFVKKYASFKHKDWTLHRVLVEGRVDSTSIYNACKAKQMRPVCDHAAYFDGRCEVVGGDTHMSRQDSIKGVVDAFFYCGRANETEARQHVMGSHRWSNRFDRDGETICTKQKGDKFNIGHHILHRTVVSGEMNSSNIRAACTANKMKPACDHGKYNDGHCVSFGRWHLSHPSQDKSHGVDPKQVQWAFFYCGQAHGQRSRLNRGPGRENQWSSSFHKDGETYCVGHDAQFFKKHSSVKHGKHKLERVAVKGKMTSQSILAACKKVSLLPVCDHGAYFDGQCVVVGVNKSMSRQGSIKAATDAYFYCGSANGTKTLQHQHGNNHRWSNGNDANGATLCTEKTDDIRPFTYMQYEMHRIQVTGYMTSQNILNACEAKQMKPVCDHQNYNDGKCQAFGDWHFSNGSHNRQHKLNVNKTKWAFFYCGEANGNKSRINTGTSHRWTHNNTERDGDTFCAKRDPEFMKKHGNFSHNKFVLNRVDVAGRINTESIWKACQAKGLRPVCDHENYFDGRCVVVNGNKHMSSQDAVKGTWGAYFYCGSANGTKARQHQHGRHRWSNDKDAAGQTICTKPVPASLGDVTFRHFVLHRTPVDGFMNSSNILKACRKKGMKPLCDRMSYNDGHCKAVGGNWSFSNMSVVKRHGIDVQKVRYAFFYCGRANHTRSLLNTGKPHTAKWTRDRWEQDGDSYCVSRDKDFLKNHGTFKHNNFELKRVAVAGVITSESIWKACQAKALRPVCDHQNYFDGRCVVVGGSKTMSRQDSLKGISQAYIYCGNANETRARQHMLGRHRWSNSNDQNGETICTSPREYEKFNYSSYELHRIQVDNYMTSENIFKACQAKGMKPVCDKASYQDGKCSSVGGNWHFSYPHHDKQHGIDVKKVQYAFFYCGKANHQRSLLNTGKTHKWSRDNFERDGDTFCATRNADFLNKHGSFKHADYTLKRVAVVGKINSDSIWEACQAKGLRPVCDHEDQFDGRCVVVNGNKHMSRQDAVKGVWDAFFYSGRASCTSTTGCKARQHKHNSHRWSNEDQNGDTVCTKRPLVNFNFSTYVLEGVQVEGFMTSENIFKACQAKGMKPVCAHRHYQDGKCSSVGGNWHFSYPHHNKQNGIDVKKVQYAFFYCGKANHQRSLLNTGRTHKWSRDNFERDGDTFCATRNADFLKKHGSFKHADYTLERVAVVGKINSDSIWKACQAKKGLRPVCDHENYFDGRCVVVNGNKYMSRQDSIKGVQHAYFYCGSANGNKARQHLHRSHRWSNGNDQNGQTFCTERAPGLAFKFRSYILQRTQVDGIMNKDSILNACRNAQMIPVCDHRSYRDVKCKAFGNWHFSYPPHDRSHGVDVNKVKWAYFYTGRHGHGARLNTGRTHRWLRDPTKPKAERDGDTFCAKPDPDFEHSSFSLYGFNLTRVQVSGRMISDRIFKACQKAGLRPVCEHAAYFDGRCVVVGGHKHMSREKAKGVWEAYFYSGHANHQQSLVDTAGGHHWSGQDSDHGTICTKPKVQQPKKGFPSTYSFSYKGFEMHRVKVPGYMNSENIDSACKAKRLKPVCDHSNYKDGKCIAFGPWHFSKPHDDRRHKIDVKKVQYAFFYSGQEKGTKSQINMGNTHKWTDDNRERDGDTFCTKRDPNWTKKHSKFSHNSFKLHRVTVAGKINSESIWKACQENKMRPVCDHAKNFDGRCAVVQPGNGHRHMSREDKLEGAHHAYFYCGSAEKRARQHLDGGHRWSKDQDADGVTVCTKTAGTEHMNIKFGTRELIRVQVAGHMTADNIVNACKTKGMKPLCNHLAYQDGKCKAVGGAWHMSYPGHSSRHYAKLDVNKMKWVFFYTGPHHTGALLHTATSHRWANPNTDRDGDTFCVPKDHAFAKKYGKFDYEGYTLERVPVPGKIDSDTILRACQQKGMRPVCDLDDYFDGRCVVVNKHKHMSREDKLKGVWDVFFYSGSANGNKARQHLHGRHRWSDDKDADGETMCTRPQVVTKFSYSKHEKHGLVRYEMHRVQVPSQKYGVMSKDSILKACKAKGMLPVCDHAAYSDSNCKVVGGSWHFSYPSHDRSHGVDVNKVKWAYFYTGPHHTGARLNTETTHRWLRDPTKPKAERDGDTFCTKHGTFGHQGRRLVRVQVEGRVTKDTILAACKAKGLRPVCDYAGYFDGRCEVVSDHKRMSHTKNVEGVSDAWFYTGRHGDGALLHMRKGHSHRWNKANDENGETICTARKEVTVDYEGHKLVRTEVQGPITKDSIFEACDAKGMQPLCDHTSYQDDKCRAVGGAWHMSHPHHSSRHYAKLDVNKMKFAFFYTGPHGTGARLHTGTSHRWANSRDHDGDTFCVHDIITQKLARGSAGLHWGDTVALWNKAGKSFVRMDESGKWMDKSSPRPDGTLPSDSEFEQFKVVKGKPGLIGLWSIKTRKFMKMSAQNYMERSGEMGEDAEGEDELQFRVVNAADGNVALWNPVHKRFVRMHNSKYMERSGKREHGTLPAGWAWEQFKVVTVTQAGKRAGACQGSVVLYQNGNFHGWRARFPRGDYDQSRMEKHGGRNNQASAIEVPKGCIAVLYGNPNFSGWSATFYPGRYKHSKFVKEGGKSDQTSSLRVVDADRFKHGAFTFDGYSLVRVRVQGKVTRDSIWQTCQNQGLRPVCDRRNYFDGRCEIVFKDAASNLHMSRQHQLKGITNSAFYTGPHGHGALVSTATSHKWVQKEWRGDTVCTQRKDRESMSFEYQNKKLYRTKVDFETYGGMSKDSIYNACKAKGMLPVCNHAAYRDIKCKAFGNWHFSYPPHDRSHGVDVNKVKYAYFYTGRHGSGALLNTGSTLRWAKSSDRDGDTFCVGEVVPHPAERIHVGDKVGLWNTAFKTFARMPDSEKWMVRSSPRNDGTLPNDGTLGEMIFTVQKGDGDGTISLYGEHPDKRKGYMQMSSSSYMSTSPDKGASHGTVFKVVPGKDKSIALWSPRYKRFVRMNEGSGSFMGHSGEHNNANLPDEKERKKVLFQVVVHKKAPKGKCQGQVSLYQHGNFNGWHAQFPKGSYANLRQKGAKANEVSSIKVPKGCVATLYYNEGYGGGTGTFTAGDYPSQRFTQFFKDNKASSMKVKDST